MRLIDADRMKQNIKIGDEHPGITAMLEGWIDCQPRIDAEPVVRCKDCAYWGIKLSAKRNGHDYGDCANNSYMTKDCHYCAWGERMETDG